MTNTRTAHLARVGLALAIVLTTSVMAGCNNPTGTATKPPAKPVNTRNAKGAAAVAMSTIASVAPDAKLILCQTVAPIPATSTPIWEFLIGSPKTGLVYSALIVQGKAQTNQYGQVTLSAAEWAKIPSLDAWKIDSDVAHEKALSVYPQGKKAEYMSQFLMYRPQGAPKTAAKPMTWSITFDPASKGKATTSTVLVDMVTGAASLAK